MKVTFPDGTVIWHRQAIDTFIDALRKIGLERIPAEYTPALGSAASPREERATVFWICSRRGYGIAYT
jgi:hypothetical protein